MRLFFLMLLLLNGVFFAVNALREPMPSSTNNDLDTNTPQLTLLSEKQETKAETKLAINEDEPKLEPPTEPSLDLQTWLAKFTADTESDRPQSDSPQNPKPTFPVTAQCYTAGPFQNTDNIQQAKTFFNDANISFQQKSIIENHYIGMLVYLPSQKNREAIVKTANALAAKGVKDYMLLNEPGKRHSLSLGVYGLKKNAEQRIKVLSKLDYFAKSEARYRKKTIYWLDYSLNNDDKQTDLIAQHMKSLNVSQIQRNCKT